MFAKGRGHGSESSLKVLKFIPRARTPWQPSQFRRHNLTLEDLGKFWNGGRQRYGAGHYNSGYGTMKHHTIEEQNVDIIPKHELEKYMPDIAIGPKALVTPVSVMNARSGHRVTHDLLHSYDAHVGRVEKDAWVDHDNITPQDPNRAGLHGTALDCRGRIFRWLRRGPFFNEDQYFRRYVTAANVAGGAVDVEVEQEVPLHRQILASCKHGDLKSACEAYRRLTHPPPVEVYRALTAACVPHGQIADAIAVFEDGNAKLFFIARDGEVLLNVMRAAISATHRSRIMWTLNVTRGRYFENRLARAEVDPLYAYRIAAAAIAFYLEQGCGEEARSVYSAMQADGLLNYDLFIKIGQQLQQQLLGGGPADAAAPPAGAADGSTGSPSVTLPKLNEASFVNACSLQQNALNFAPLIAEAVLQQAGQPLTAPLRGTLDHPARAAQWLSQRFPDVDVLFVARLARFQHDTDLMALQEQSTYATRCAGWLDVLSARHDDANGATLPYLRKSKASAALKTVRVAWLPERRRAQRMLPGELGFRFHFAPSTRFVDESFPQVPPGDVSIRSQFLAMQPTQVDVPCAVRFDEERRRQALLQQLEEGVAGGSSRGGLIAPRSLSSSSSLAARNVTRILDPSVFAAAPSLVVGASAGGSAAGSVATSTAASSGRAAEAPAF